MLWGSIKSLLFGFPAVFFRLGRECPVVCVCVCVCVLISHLSRITPPAEIELNELCKRATHKALFFTSLVILVIA